MGLLCAAGKRIGNAPAALRYAVSLKAIQSNKQLGVLMCVHVAACRLLPKHCGHKGILPVLLSILHRRRPLEVL